MQSDNGKLFVGGISWDTNEERLKEYFGAFGDVVEAVIMKDRSTGRARGFGFVVFADPNVADRVIKEKHSIDGRMVEAKKAIPRDDQSIPSRNSTGSFHGSPGPGHSRKIFVGGLAPTVTESDFKSYFDQFGTITDVVVMYDHNTQRPRGFGFITYDSEDAVDKVLTKTFHELNGKMVEVKRAVPKELSPGPSRSPLSAYNYGLSRVNSFLNGYSQGYSPSSVGGYSLRMDGRYSPSTVGLGGFSPVGSGHGMGMNLDQVLSPTYGATGNFGSNLGYARGMNPFYVGNSNRFANSIGYDSGNGGNSSFFSSASRNLWGIGGMGYNLNSGISNSQIGSGAGNGGSFVNSSANWGSSSLISRAGGTNIALNDLTVGYGGESNFDLEETTGYRRNSMNGINQTTSFSASNGSFDGSFPEFYGGNSDYNDRPWRSLDPEREESGPFDYGITNPSVDIPVKSSPGYIGGYTVNKRQSSRGIAA